MKRIATIAAFIGMVLLASQASAQQKSLKDQLAGTWTLISAETTGKDGKPMPFVGGSNIKGMMVLDGTRISFQVIADIPKLASKDRMITSADENRAVAHGLLTFFGTYTVNEADKSVVLHIERSSYPDQNETDAKRTFNFVSADELKWGTPARLAGGTNDFSWRRTK